MGSLRHAWERLGMDSGSVRRSVSGFGNACGRALGTSGPTLSPRRKRRLVDG